MPNKKITCEICGFDRSGTIDRCHIVPRHLLTKTNGYSRYANFPKGGGINIFYLCRNHHALFDQFRLTADEWLIIAPKIKKMKLVIVEMLNAELGHNAKNPNFYQKQFIERRKRSFEKWKTNLAPILLNLGVIFRNVTTK